MSQLTQEHFDETMRSIADTLADHGTQLAAIDATLADHTARLERLERQGDVSARVDKIQILLAEQFGRDVLARVGL